MSSPTNHDWRWMICFSNSWHATEDSRLVWRSSCNEIEPTNRKETQQNANFIGTLHRRARLFQTTWEFLTCAVNQTAVVAPLLFRVNQVQLGRDAFVILNGLILRGTTNFNTFQWVVTLSRLSYAIIILPYPSHYNWQTCFKGWNPGKHWTTSPKGTGVTKFLDVSWLSSHMQKQTGWDSFSSRSFRGLGSVAKQHSQWTRPSDSLGIWRTSCIAAGKTAIPQRASN